jgi:phosphoribosylformylglycinamidine cyclo-ligase
MADRRDTSSDGKGLTYRDAGVDIGRQDEGLRRIRELVRGTRTAGVLADIGSFGGLFAPALKGLEAPVLVSSCDGVGTKLSVAFRSGVHHTVGRDLVNHCVNDILVQGARPLFFMDYLATGGLDPAVMEQIVQGVARGCREAGCALLGGETAEMPGFYTDGEYDLAGFIVGIVDRERILDGSKVAAGDVLLGLPSAGLHTNGYSLARKILFDVAGHRLDERVEALGATVQDALLAEHRSYLRALEQPIAEGLIHALAHITGGGIPDNLSRVLPEGKAARVDREAWPVPAVFRYMQEVGRVAQAEMERTFNMGVGMLLVVAPESVESVEQHLDAVGEGHHRVGEIVDGDRGVRYG